MLHFPVDNILLHPHILHAGNNHRHHCLIVFPYRFHPSHLVKNWIQIPFLPIGRKQQKILRLQRHPEVEYIIHPITIWRKKVREKQVFAITIILNDNCYGSYGRTASFRISKRKVVNNFTFL